MLSKVLRQTLEGKGFCCDSLLDLQEQCGAAQDNEDSEPIARVAAFVIRQVCNVVAGRLEANPTVAFHAEQEALLRPKLEQVISDLESASSDEILKSLNALLLALKKGRVEA